MLNNDRAPGSRAGGLVRGPGGWAAIARQAAFVVAALLLLARPTAQGQAKARIGQAPLPLADTPYGQRVILVPGDSACRQFGDIMLYYRLAPSATAVQCTIYVATQLAGIRQLNATAPTFDFDVQVGYGQAHGTLTLQLITSPQPRQVSTLAGQFTYSGNDQQFTFKGDLIGWYAVP